MFLLSYFIFLSPWGHYLLFIFLSPFFISSFFLFFPFFPFFPHLFSLSGGCVSPKVSFINGGESFPLALNFSAIKKRGSQFQIFTRTYNFGGRKQGVADSKIPSWRNKWGSLPKWLLTTPPPQITFQPIFMPPPNPYYFPFFYFLFLFFIFFNVLFLSLFSLFFHSSFWLNLEEACWLIF